MRIARRIAGDVDIEAPGSWRLAEHFDAAWRPVSEYNADKPRHPFRPYGSQIGHWLEWSKLLMQLDAQGVDEGWFRPAAETLFRKAIEEGWRPSGGFIYTVDWDGQPVVSDKYFWAPPEGIGAACLLWQATGDPWYLDWYRRLWRYVDECLLDRSRGGWFCELDEDNLPVSRTWQGKPDLYHAFQATLYAETPAEQSLACWARSVRDEWGAPRSAE